jgi:phage terminase large subunit GpA-like protein
MMHHRLDITEAQYADMKNFLRGCVRNIPSSISEMSVSQYAELRRIMPEGNPRPGPWSNDYTPYLAEIMDNMSIASPVQRTVVCKGAQVGLTAAMENVMCYYMDEVPSDILFISASEALFKRWVSRRLEPAIDSCGFREKIIGVAEQLHGNRRGDLTYSKEYSGCRLDMASAQSAGLMRATDKRILIRDEIDGAPPLLLTGEGKWLDVSYARTNAWGSRKKIFDGSTPTTFEISQIWREFERGDRRKFFVPCPHCGAYQELVFLSEGGSHGLKADFVDERLARVYYVCEHCHDRIDEHHKTAMLLDGYWQPTAISHDPHMRSYHLSVLYSPPGMLSWNEIYRMYLKAQGEQEGMRWFNNLYLGLPHKETGSRPRIDKVIELRGGYRQGTISDGVLFLTCGIDVQAGSETNTDNPPRIELEIVGHGAGYRTWSVLYRRIEGNVRDATAGAWAELSDWANAGGMVFYRADGMAFPVRLVFIDAGDAANTMDAVYRFSASWNNTFPIKGFSTLKRLKTEGIDPVGAYNFRRYRAIKVGQDVTLYELSTNYYKNHLYNNLKISRQDIEPQKAGFCDFPVDYDEKYFRMLTAEEKQSNGSFYCPAGRRNEALDCRVYALAAADVFLDAEVMAFKAAAQSRGARPDQVQLVNHHYVLQYFQRLCAKL